MYDGIVVAGGAARRMGTDKTALPVGGRTLLQRALDALVGAGRRIVVGPPRADLPSGVLLTREDPPGGGPAAAVVAGLAYVTSGTVVLLAADLPFVDDATVRRLAGAAAGPRGAVLADDAGAPQWLCSAWPAGLLREAAATRDSWHDTSLRALLGGLPHTLVPPGDGAPAWWDVDTPDDLAQARSLDD